MDVRLAAIAFAASLCSLAAATGVPSAGVQTDAGSDPGADQPDHSFPMIKGSRADLDHPAF
jgi:hypothetical protein